MTEKPDFANDYINLAEPKLGGAICSVTDDFFAPAKRMLSIEAPIFIPDKFDAHGKWMDGWESRRKRTSGHDYCVLRICNGVIKGFEIDTSHFTGNFAPAASIEACRVDIDPDEQTQWTELLPRSDLKGDSQQFFSVDDENSWSHIRLNIYPDGGIARLKVFGKPEKHHASINPERLEDLSSSAVGGQALQCNNMHYGDMANLLSTQAVANMGDGWETRRRRHPGNDWVILKLGRPGQIYRVEVDTAFFKGNYPARCSLKGAYISAETDIASDSANWDVLLAPVGLGPDQLHIFDYQISSMANVTHVRLDIFPDGGVARLRLLGVAENDSSSNSDED